MKMKQGATGGWEEHNPRLKAELNSLFSEYHVSDEAAAEVIEELLSLEFRRNTGLQWKKDHPETPDQYKKSMTKYIKALEKARAAWFELSPEVAESLSTNLPYTPQSMFTEHFLRELSKATFTHKLELTGWRREQLSGRDMWGADIELIDLLISSAKAWMERHAPDKHATTNPDHSFITRAKELFEFYGIPATTTTDGLFIKTITACIGYEPSATREKVRRALSK